MIHIYSKGFTSQNGKKILQHLIYRPRTAEIKVNRSKHSACSVNHFVYIIGGSNGRNLNGNIYKYKISSNKWLLVTKDAIVPQVGLSSTPVNFNEPTGMKTVVFILGGENLYYFFPCKFK